jgi:hypothetical protein
MLGSDKRAATLLSTGAFHRIRTEGSIRGFTFQPADFGKNRKSFNESSGRDCIASCPLWKGRLGWARVCHGPIQLTAQTAGLLSYFLSSLFPERGYGFSKFKGGKQAVIVLPVDDDVIIRGQ